jgi:hypothetical protein
VADIFNSSIGVTMSNISDISRIQSIGCEQRICEIAELAERAAASSADMIKDGVHIYEMLVALSEEYGFFNTDIHAEALSENKDRLSFYNGRLSLMDKAYFSELYFDALKKNDVTLYEEDFLPAVSSAETFVYVKNIYADEAYDVFTQDFEDPRVQYAKNFKEAVGLVDTGTVTYCLLPLEERGARLATVAELLYRSELKINSVIPVFGIDGSADIKYALVSRGYTVPKKSPDDDRYLEIRLAAQSDLSLSELLCVAESYGIQIYRVNTLSFSTDEGKNDYYSVVFSGENVDFTTLLVFLTLFSADYTAIGIYKNLES